MLSIYHSRAAFSSGKKECELVGAARFAGNESLARDAGEAQTCYLHS
jgi:hypothetical protein